MISISAAGAAIPFAGTGGSSARLRVALGSKSNRVARLPNNTFGGRHWLVDGSQVEFQDRRHDNRADGNWFIAVAL